MRGLRGAIAIALLAAIGFAPGALGGSRPLRTAIVVGGYDPTDALAYARIAAAGATVVRIGVLWPEVAPTRPAAPGNPADPAYDWSLVDTEVALARAHGLAPMLSIEGAPLWAQDRSTPLPFTPPPTYYGTVRPDPVAYGQFAGAAALRYSGTFAGRPRVSLWRLYNEPNLSVYLLPQLVGSTDASATRYREMVNLASAAIHRVHADDVVVAGGLAPFEQNTNLFQAVAPMRFMRDVLCMAGRTSPRPTCSTKTSFNVWSIHPYTTGGPTNHAFKPDDLSLGDVPEAQRLLDAAVRAGHVSSRTKPEMWVTELGWDTNPPDPNPLATPIMLQSRWVSEALYNLWSDGVSLVTWLSLHDLPYPQATDQSGLWFRGRAGLRSDFPKPSLTAFRFPFVAYKQRGGIFVWGRTPSSRAARVVVEANAGGGWRRQAILRADRYGIFSATLPHVRFAPAGRDATVTNAGALAAYRKAVLRDKPLFYWTLDDANGAVARDIVRGYNGRYVGQPKSVAGAFPGTADRAVSLDGKDDRVDLGVVESARTVELWLKTRAFNEAAAFSNRNTISRFTFLGVVDGQRARSYDTSGLFGRTWITDGRWHHLVYTYDSGRGALYVDGRLDDSGSFPRFESGAEAYIGHDATLKNYLRGAVDEVAVYDHALSAAQVRAHFLASGRPLSYADQFAFPDGKYLRARLAGGSQASLPFSLHRPPDRFVAPIAG